MKARKENSRGLYGDQESSSHGMIGEGFPKGEEKPELG